MIQQAVFVAAVRGDCDERPPSPANGLSVSHQQVWATLRHLFLNSGDIEQRHSSLHAMAFVGNATLLLETLAFAFAPEQRARPYACPGTGAGTATEGGICSFDGVLPLLRTAAFNVKAGGLAVAVKFASDHFLKAATEASAASHYANAAAPPPSSMSRVIRTLSEFVWDRASQHQVQRLVDDYVGTLDQTDGNSTLITSLKKSLATIEENVDWRITVGAAVCGWLQT
jgi:hypothetical protein